MKTSIIIPVWNALPYLKQAIASIHEFTEDHDYELVLVDNASRPECVEYILSLNCVSVFNDTNRGPGEALSQGIKASSGEYICLLNSDARVTKNWLAPLIATLQADPQIGIAGALSDNISSIQNCMELKKYYPIVLMKGYVMPFVCVLLPRWVFTRKGVGLIAKRFRMGNSEDSEFCLRLDKAGLLKAVCPSSFAYHALSRSYADNGVNCTTACSKMGELVGAYEEIEYLDA
jgi:GT2 family glycosyltransferase